MPFALFETGHCNVDLKSSPIEPSWIIEGNPEARSHWLPTSAETALPRPRSGPAPRASSTGTTMSTRPS